MTRSCFRCVGLLVGGCSLFLASSLQAMEPIDFHDDIFPILEARCFKCHSDEKQKGDLRLDSPAWILRGSENGDVLVPGDPDDSSMYYLTTYDEDDPDYMPSKGKGLTEQEQQLLNRWIMGGASFGDEMGGMMAMADSVPPSSSAKKKYTDDVPLPPASYEISGELADTVTFLEAAGLRVDTVNHDAEYLEITYTYAIDSDAYSLALLEPVAGAVVKLNFGRSRVLDGQLKGIGRFSNLTYLDLRKTSVTDAALGELRELSSLEYLNLFGTEVTDEGLKQLRGLKSLRQIYLSGTSVSNEGVQALAKSIPGLKVFR